ncbi:TENA_THI-4 domain-containing protein/HAD domain-containing protein [Cephalotus follicularis]|uniref:TENA_THI-4 domain-containing protein/HAD domain-containing protein n=1 Tax=Cephalotus follicularis TaxID=3775 RepID=A0A1Q3D6C7_CEPFO|nr:TENA_THI-4 domain-containing protein/HAD domain-containing protein [Cephalotus follicularis]
MVRMEEGGNLLARRLWKKFERESVFAKYTPFVVCLASGKLDSNTFRHFLSQDVHFLRTFKHAYQMAEECADDEQDRTSIRKLRKRVNRMLKTHLSLVPEWSFQLSQEEEKEEEEYGSTPTSATLKYTDFLMATASGKVGGNLLTPFERTKVSAYTLAAMAPCISLCAYISKEIQGFLGPHNGTNHIYKKWVDNYCSLEFEAEAKEMEEMLDGLSVSLTGEELGLIEKLYHQAMKLELDFFYAQPIVEQTVVPLSRKAKCGLTIFSDFDLTCTAFDSSAILAEIAIVTAPKAADPHTQLSRMSKADLRNTWSLLSTQYAEEYEQCIENILSYEKVETFNYEVLCKALQQIADFEKNANLRVIQSGVLKGLNLEDIRRAGQSLILQDGCRDFFQKVVDDENLKSDVHVISYCWCGDLIRSAFTSGNLDVIKVHSNELAYEESISTAKIVRKLESPMEKLQVLIDILKDRSNSEQHLTVYIGGSVGDLLCLLEADIGIVMGATSSLMKLGDQFGVSFVPLFSGLVEKQRELAKAGSFDWKGLPGTLYTVSSWAEIEAFILAA